jgi:hypothetical protein
MSDKNTGLDTLKDIKHIMERSSRFISLSGLSGIAAGVCALVGAWFAYDIVNEGSRYKHNNYNDYYSVIVTLKIYLGYKLFRIALLTLIAAFISALIFTWLKSKKNNTPIWGISSQRLMWNLAFPLIAGGFFLLRMIQLGYFGMIAPGCLIF